MLKKLETLSKITIKHTFHFIVYYFIFFIKIDNLFIISKWCIISYLKFIINIQNVMLKNVIIVGFNFT